MSIIRLVGDVHLGKKFPFTTKQSAALFQQEHDQLMADILDAGADEFICLGDLFDDFEVDGSTLVKGYQYAKELMVLAGNHDIANNTEKASALLLLNDVLKVDVVYKEVRSVPRGRTTFALVPYFLEQGLFDDALKRAAHVTQEKIISDHKVLLLHCNFGNREGTVTENYLTREMAKQMLETFDLVVCGHEHNFNTPMKGVVMLGSVMPFSFGEMTDKFVMDYDTDTGEYQLTPTWKSANYSSMDYKDFLECNASVAPFMEITGTIDVTEAAAINKKIGQLYKENGVLSIKNATTLHRAEAGVTVVDEVKTDWETEVRKELPDRYLPLFEELLSKVKK